MIKRREEARRSILSKAWANHRKSDKQKIFSEALTFPLQLALHERLVSVRLIKLWHDPFILCPSKTLTKLWESSDRHADAALGATCKTTVYGWKLLFVWISTVAPLPFKKNETAVIIASNTKCLTTGKSLWTIPIFSVNWHSCVSKAVTLKSRILTL